MRCQHRTKPRYFNRRVSWDDTKYVDREGLGNEGKHSRCYVSNEHVRGHSGRTTAETCRQLEQNSFAAEGQRVALMTVETIKGIRGDVRLYLFWTKVTSKAGAIDVGKPALPRRRKAPMPIPSLPVSMTGSTNLDTPFFVHQNRC